MAAQCPGGLARDRGGGLEVEFNHPEGVDYTLELVTNPAEEGGFGAPKLLEDLSLSVPFVNEPEQHLHRIP
jgi:hypothetical protein